MLKNYWQSRLEQGIFASLLFDISKKNSGVNKMKKMILALGVVASVLVLASCASKGAVDQTVPAPEQTKHGQHDYKGEVK